MRKLIIGCGYLGQRVASVWLNQGHQVTALTRSAEHAEKLNSRGIKTLIGDVTNPKSLSQLPHADTILYAVGFDRNCGKSLRDVYVNGLKNVLRLISTHSQHVIYISSSSVYGQTQGEWVDETSPCVPSTPNGEICLEAEQRVWQHFPENTTSSPASANVLRLAGIYGPGRLLRRLEQIKSNEPIEGNPHAWLNLIHVEDAVRAVQACEQLGLPGKTYLVCDDQPITRQEYYQTLAKLAQTPVPDFLESDSRNCNKRCSNRRLHEELEIQLAYPTIQTGLEHALNSTNAD